MKPLRLALLLGIGGVMRAQDYQPVNSGRIAYFERGGEVRCIRIDSTIFDSDSVLYPFSNVSSFSYECYTPDGPSWIGEKIIVRENGMNLFFNKVQDTIRIDMHAMTGESWIAYRSAAGNIVEATVLDHDTLNFMGLSDSVKTIGFQVYDAGMSPVSHKANNFTVGISKSYGFTKTLNFNLFPDIIEESILTDQPGEFYLAGLSTPRVGIQNLTWFEVYDFQPDDEIHVVKTRSMFGDPQTCPEYGETIKQTFKYLDRSDYPDSIIYTVEIGMNRDQNWEDSSAFESSHDTIITVIHRNPQFDHLPGEPVIADFSFHVYGMVTGDLVQRTGTEPRMVFDYSGDDCWALPIYDGCTGTTRYIKGLGGPFSSCSGGLDCYMESDEKPVYYKKGDRVWGTPVILAHYENNRPEDEVSIYPNPPKDFLRIQIPNGQATTQFELVDLHGRVLKSIIIHDSNARIDLEEGLKGLYLYRLSGGNGTSTGRILIE